jgi:hypothetical protein
MTTYGFSEYYKDKKEDGSNKKKIAFEELPQGSNEILNNKRPEDNDFNREETVGIPSEDNQQQSHLSLILSPNLRDLELMIRGLEYVKRYNKIT